MRNLFVILAFGVFISNASAQVIGPGQGCGATGQPDCAVKPGSSTTPFDVNLKQVGGNTTLVGAGATGTGSQRTTVAVDSSTVAGSATVPAGSNLIGKAGFDETTPGVTNLVSAGFSQQIASTPTVQNASYVSGNCIGGFNAVTVTVNNGQSGFITNFRVVSAGGSTPTVTVYLFDSNPSSSTCTDRSTFTLNSADLDKIIATPTAVMLAAPTGSTASFASVEYIPPRPFIAGGATNSGVKTIYYGLVSGTTFTPGSTADVHTRQGVVLN